MSELSEAYARAQLRLDKMTEADRIKLYHIVLIEELRRPDTTALNEEPKT